MGEKLISSRGSGNDEDAEQHAYVQGRQGGVNLTGAGVAKEIERLMNGRKSEGFSQMESEQEGEQEGEPARRESLEKGFCEGRVGNFCRERKLQLQRQRANGNESTCKPLHSISHL